MKASWSRLAAMVATSTVIMFGLMYQLIYSIDHATFSMSRFIASLVMACVMTIVMVAFTWKMYEGREAKYAVLVLAALAGAALLTVNRRQLLVGDVAFMRAMIPHHSIAINNARKAHINDPRVRKLADDIIAAQVKEIAEMQLLLADIEKNGERGSVNLPARSAELTPDLLEAARAAVR